MKKLSITLILVLGFMASAFSQPVQLKNFDELLNALRSGEKVRAVFHYAKCKQIADNEEKEKSPDAIGGMDIDTYEYFAANSVKNKDPFLVASTAKLIQYPKGDGFVYNYVKVKVAPDNKVKVTAQYVDSKSFEIRMDENFFGEIDDGKNEKGVFFYLIR